VAANGGSFVYEKCDLLQSSADVVAELTDYTFRMLDAFGVKEGASHNEVMMTKAGPALIEINPRVSGAQIPRLATLAIGEGQLEWTLRVLLERAKTPNGFYEPYQVRQHAMLCPLISHVQGRFAGLRFKDELESLPSFQFADYFVEVGGSMPLTVDCYTQPGIVFLAHPDEATLERDYERVRQLERNGLYDVAA
jgi:L-amino acid ligase